MGDHKSRPLTYSASADPSRYYPCTAGTARPSERTDTVKLYIDTRESSTLAEGRPRSTGYATVYVVRMFATRSQDGRELARFGTLAQAQEYVVAATSGRYGLQRTA